MKILRRKCLYSALIHGTIISQQGRKPNTEGGILMYRVDVWYRPWGCFCPGVNTYPTKAQADDRAAAMRAVGHRVKVVSATAKKYTSK